MVIHIDRVLLLGISVSGIVEKCAQMSIICYSPLLCGALFVWGPPFFVFCVAISASNGASTNCVDAFREINFLNNYEHS